MDSQPAICDEPSQDDDGFCESCPLDSPARLERARKALIRAVCILDVPPRYYVSPEYEDVVKCLNPFFELGDFESLKDDCVKFFERDAIRIKHALSIVDAKVNVSVETFKSDFHYDDFMCLTARFIGEDWKLKKWVLKLRTFDSKSLDSVICECLDHWGIRDRVLTLALKSFSFDGEIVELVKDYIHEKNPLLLGGKLFHVHCCAKLLSSMAQDAVKGIADIIEEKLRELYPMGNSPPVWNVPYKTLKMVLELNSRGEFTSDDLGFSYDEYLPSVEEWERVEGVSKLVDKLHTAAEVLFHAKHPSAFLYLSNLHLLHARLMEEDSSNSCTFVSAIREKIMQKFEKYWESMFPLLAVAVVMDPRCKMAYIEYLSSKVPGSNYNGNAQSSAVLVIVQNLYETYLATTKLEDSFSDSSPSECESSEEEEDEEEGDRPVSDKKRKIDAAGSGKEMVIRNCVNAEMASHMQDYQQFVQASKQSARSELELYLEEPVLAWDEEFKLLKWWKTKRAKFPTLSRMARDLLSIPFSVATSYDAYYTEDRLVDKHLLSSKPVLMNALKCTRSWNQNR